jgi:hypothetical protein
MFIDQLIRLSSEDDTEIVKAKNNPFDLTARGQFNHHMVSISPDTIEKLILDINLVLDHARPPSPQKDLISRNIFPRSIDSSHQ